MEVIPKGNSFLRVGIIGMGHRGKRHLDAVNRSVNTNAEWIYDPQINVKSQMNIPALTSLQELVLHDVDFIILSVPHSEYLKMIRLCCQCGIKHILKEKPIAICMQEATQIQALEREYNLNIAIACQRRYSRAINKIKEFIVEHGPPLEFFYRYYLGLRLEQLDLNDWREIKNFSGGGAVIDMGYHAIDILADLLGQPEDVSCILRKPVKESVVESGASINFYYPNTYGTVHLERFMSPKSEMMFFHWRNFSLHFVDNCLKLINNQGEKVIIPYEDSGILLDRQLEDFTNFVLGKENSVCRISDAMNTMGIIENCYASPKWLIPNQL